MRKARVAFALALAGTVALITGYVGTTQAQQRRQVYLPSLIAPPAATLTIMPLGDSITEGVNGGYRDVLWERLTSAGLTVDFVGPRSDRYADIADREHAGTPGFNSSDILRNVDAYMATYRPDVVLLMVGTNDLAWWTTEAPSAVEARVGRTIDRIAAASPETRVILATIAPIADRSVPPQGRSRTALVREYNAAVRALAARRGLTLVDVEAALALSDLYDGVHPREEAHDAKIAPLWAAAILGE
jgi:lysophospholipase L1-like esterase